MRRIPYRGKTYPRKKVPKFFWRILKNFVRLSNKVFNIIKFTKGKKKHLLYILIKKKRVVILIAFRLYIFSSRLLISLKYLSHNIQLNYFPWTQICRIKSFESEVKECKVIMVFPYIVKYTLLRVVMPWCIYYRLISLVEEKDNHCLILFFWNVKLRYKWTVGWVVLNLESIQWEQALDLRAFFHFWSPHQ